MLTIVGTHSLRNGSDVADGAHIAHAGGDRLRHFEPRCRRKRRSRPFDASGGCINGIHNALSVGINGNGRCGNDDWSKQVGRPVSHRRAVQLTGSERWIAGAGRDGWHR